MNEFSLTCDPSLPFQGWEISDPRCGHLPGMILSVRGSALSCDGAETGDGVSHGSRCRSIWNSIRQPLELIVPFRKETFVALLD